VAAAAPSIHNASALPECRGCAAAPVQSARAAAAPPTAALPPTDHRLKPVPPKSNCVVALTFPQPAPRWRELTRYRLLMTGQEACPTFLRGKAKYEGWNGEKSNPAAR